MNETLSGLGEGIGMVDIIYILINSSSMPRSRYTLYFAAHQQGSNLSAESYKCFLFEYYLDILINKSIQVQVLKKLLEQYCTSVLVKDPSYHLS